MYRKGILFSFLIFIILFSSFIEISTATLSEPIYYNLPPIKNFPSDIYALNDEKIWMLIPKISKIGCLNPELSSISFYDLIEDSIPIDFTIAKENIFIIFSNKKNLALFSLTSFNLSFFEIDSEPIDLIPYNDGVWISLPDKNEIALFSITSKSIVKRIKCSVSSSRNVLTISSNYLWAILDRMDQIARISLNSYEIKILNLSFNALLLASSINDEIWIFNEKNEILKIDQNGKIIYKTSLGEGAYLINKLVTSLDGSLWYIDIGRSKIGYITYDGKKEEILIRGSSIRSFSLSPSNKLWFIDEKNNRIGFTEYFEEKINKTSSISIEEETTSISTISPISPMIFTEFIFGILLIVPIIFLLIKRFLKRRK